MRSRVALIMLLVLSTGCVARSAPIADVSLGQPRYNESTQTTTFPIINSSKHAVVAYNITIKTEDDNDGAAGSFQMSQDFLGTALLKKFIKDLPDDPRLVSEIPPGGVYETNLPLSNGNLQTVELTLDVVIFDDHSAEATNTAAFERLIGERKAAAATIEKVNGADREKVKAMSKAWDAKEHHSQKDLEEASSSTYMIIERELENVPPDALKDYWAMKKEQQAVWLNESNITLITIKERP